jgi:alkylhydroperoxidase family enzyme
MRALAIGRIAAHPDWFSRVTVRPEDFFAAPLPDRIGGAVLLGVLGHFDPEERAAVLAELAVRLHPESAALIDLQAPETPTLIEPFAFTAAQIGDLTYRGIAEAWPDGGERMRWRMTYLTLEDERVLAEEVNEYIFHHPAPSTVASEAASLGLRLDPAGEPSFWLLSRAGDSAEDAR